MRAAKLKPGNDLHTASGGKPRQPVYSTQEDPIGLAGGMNLYGYAAGDPINNSDPFGLCPPCEGNGLSGEQAFEIFRSLGTLKRNLTPAISVDVLSGPVTAQFEDGRTAMNASAQVALGVVITATVGTGAGDLGTGSAGALLGGPARLGGFAGGPVLFGGAAHFDLSTQQLTGASVSAGVGAVLAPGDGSSLLWRMLSAVGLGAGADETNDTTVSPP